jgi:hypothetical protein
MCPEHPPEAVQNGRAAVFEGHHFNAAAVQVAAWRQASEKNRRTACNLLRRLLHTLWRTTATAPSPQGRLERTAIINQSAAEPAAAAAEKVPTMTQMVSCSKCQSVVPHSETEFSTSGALLCRHCANVRNAHAQAERVFENAYRAAGGYRSGNVIYVNSDHYDEVLEAKRTAEGLHADLHAIAAQGPVEKAAELECSRCRAIVSTGTTTYSFEGKPMCRACAATYDERAERKKIDGTAAAGFALAFFLSVVGLWIVSSRGKLAEKDAAKYGFAAGTIILYFPLLFVLLALLQG